MRVSLLTFCSAITLAFGGTIAMGHDDHDEHAASPDHAATITAAVAR